MSIASEELVRLQEALNHRNQAILAAAMGKILVASPDPQRMRDPNKQGFLKRVPTMNSQNWTDSGYQGAVLLIYDRHSHLATFELRDISRKKSLFSYELYKNFEYISLSDDMHSFEIDDCVMGLCFADKAAGKKFNLKVQELISKRQEAATASRVRVNTFFGGTSKGNTLGFAKSLVRSRGGGSRAGGDLNGVYAINTISSAASEKPRQTSSKLRNTYKTTTTTKKKKRNIFSRSRVGTDAASTKPEREIQKIVDGSLRPNTTPGRVRVVNRVATGFDSNSPPAPSMDLRNISVDLKKIFKKAGVRKRDLADPIFAESVMKDLQKQEMMLSYRNMPEYRNLTTEQLEQAVERNLNDYNAYLLNLQDFESQSRKKALKQREQIGLSRWMMEKNPKGPPKVAPRKDISQTMRRNLTKHNETLLDEADEETASLLATARTIPKPSRASRASSRGMNRSIKKSTNTQNSIAARRQTSDSRNRSLGSFHEFDVTGASLEDITRTPSYVSRVAKPRKNGSKGRRTKNKTIASAGPPPTPLRNLRNNSPALNLSDDLLGHIPPPPPPDSDSEEDFVAPPEMPKLELGSVVGSGSSTPERKNPNVDIKQHYNLATPSPMNAPIPLSMQNKNNARNTPKGGNPKRMVSAVLRQVRSKDAKLNHVSGVMMLTMNRLNQNMSKKTENDLLGRLKSRIVQRREALEHDSESDSDWTID